MDYPEMNIPDPEVGVFWPEICSGYRERKRVHLKSDCFWEDKPFSFGNLFKSDLECCT